MLIIKPESLPYFESLDSLYQNNRTELVLNCLPSDYTAITEGEGVNLVAGYTSSYATVSISRLGFRIAVRDHREDLRILFQELKTAQIKSDNTIIPIAIKDYFYRHNGVDRELGYRERVGTIVGTIDEIGGASKSNLSLYGDRFYSKGFAFKFMEIDTIFT